MLKKNNEMLLVCAKVICKEKHEAHTFNNLDDVKKYVRDNKNVLMNVINGYKYAI